MSSIYPELIVGRSDQFEDSGWRVVPGLALRGHASCDFVNRILEVPLGSTEAERAIRAHELMHVRVSPHDVSPSALLSDVPSRALECAEEYRVNTLIARLGFPVSALTDGSEQTGGERLATNDCWEEAVYFYCATIGTGSERGFLRGVRRVRPQWIKPLALVKKRVEAIAKQHSVEEMGSTSRDSADGLPEGFARVTVAVARTLARAADAQVPTDVNGLRSLRRSLEPGGRRALTGRFAELVMLEGLEYSATAKRPYAKRGRPDVSGVQMRYPSRLLTDPYQRAFASQRRRSGGIVVIDQSGSMDLETDDIDLLLLATPGVSVIGYSHRPGDSSGAANAWLIARDGHRTHEIPGGNVGNGVDGPVLRYALSRRRAGEPIIWVTDGQVTDSNDHPSRQLSAECAELVLRHRIRLARTLVDASEMLQRGLTKIENLEQFGRVGREIASNRTD